MGSAISAQAGAWHGASRSNGAGETNFSGSGTTAELPSDKIRRSAALDASLRQSVGQSDSDKTSLLAWGTIVSGLAMLGILHKLQRSPISLSDRSLLHPELEHPELTLTSLPKEALPSLLDVETEFETGLTLR